MNDELFSPAIQTVWFGFFHIRTQVAASRVRYSDKEKMSDDDLEKQCDLIIQTDNYQLAVFQYAFLMHYLSLDLPERQDEIKRIADPFLVLQVKALMLSLQYGVSKKNKKKYNYHPESSGLIMSNLMRSIDQDACKAIAVHAADGADLGAWFTDFLVRYFAISFKDYLLSIKSPSVAHQYYKNKYGPRTLFLLNTINYLDSLWHGFLGPGYEEYLDLYNFRAASVLCMRFNNANLYHSLIDITSRCRYDRKIQSNAVSSLAEYALSCHVKVEYSAQKTSFFLNVVLGVVCAVLSDLWYVPICSIGFHFSHRLIEVPPGSIMDSSLPSFLFCLSAIILHFVYGALFSETQDHVEDGFIKRMRGGLLSTCVVVACCFFIQTYIDLICTSVVGLSELLGRKQVGNEKDFMLVRMLKCLMAGGLNQDFCVVRHEKQPRRMPPSLSNVRQIAGDYTDTGKPVLAAYNEKKHASSLQKFSQDGLTSRGTPKLRKSRVSSNDTVVSTASPCYLITWKGSNGETYCYSEANHLGPLQDSLQAYPVWAAGRSSPACYVHMLGLDQIPAERDKKSLEAVCWRGKLINARGDQGFILSDGGAQCKLKLLGSQGKGDLRWFSICKIDTSESSNDKHIPLFIFDANQCVTHNQVARGGLAP